jgi:hypothetical protein
VTQGAAHQVIRPVDVMTNVEQERLTTDLLAALEKGLRAAGKSDLAGLYFLLSFVWGWARRCRWPTSRLITYACTAWERTKQAHNEQTR